MGVAVAEFTHLDDQGRARMVDVGEKAITRREAIAQGEVHLAPDTLQSIQAMTLKKGDVLATARIAGIMATKRTSDLIPLCHSLPLDSAEVTFEADVARSVLVITAVARNQGRTGVEMEAMTAVSIAALTIYDMCKALDRGITLQNVRLLRKTGGKSGTWEAPSR